MTTASEQPDAAKMGADEATTTQEGTVSTRGGLTARLKSLIAANRAAGAAGAAARSARGAAARAGQGVQRTRTRSADALDKLDLTPKK